MPWIPQTAISTDSNRNRSRTAWLDPLRHRIQAAIRAYFDREPEGEQVTRAVFDAIEPQEVERHLAGRSLDAARRELGLRVPIELVCMYGARRVETLRRADGRTAAPRRTYKDWPRNFTPHRVRFPPENQGAVTAVAFSEGFEHQELWRRILDSWLCVLSDYREAGKDLGWWHNEAANVSLLAGGLWRLEDAVCISEYPVSRGGRDFNGRADLWFSLGGTAVDVECKQVWPINSDYVRQLVLHKLERAAIQLRSVLQSQRSPLRFSACFVSPALEADIASEAAAAMLVKAWEGVLAEGGDCAMARYVPRGDRLTEQIWNGLKFPCVMLVVRRVR